MVWHIGPQIGRVNYENLLFVYILNVLKNLRTVSDLIAKSEKFYAKSEHTKLSWSPHHQIGFGFVSDGETSVATPLERM